MCLDQLILDFKFCSAELYSEKLGKRKGAGTSPRQCDLLTQFFTCATSGTSPQQCDLLTLFCNCSTVKTSPRACNL